jgi:hypothetical protein
VAEHRISNIARWVLIVVTVFNAVSAIGGGIGLVFANGLGMPASVLGDGPFTSFVVPGLILLAVVGGTQTLAAVALIARWASALVWSAVAGFGLVIWIYVEVAIMPGYSWLQTLYFVTGIAQLTLAFALTGILAWVPRLDNQPAHPSPLG